MKPTETNRRREGDSGMSMEGEGSVGSGAEIVSDKKSEEGRDEDEELEDEML